MAKVTTVNPRLFHWWLRIATFFATKQHGSVVQLEEFYLFQTPKLALLFDVTGFEAPWLVNRTGFLFSAAQRLLLDAFNYEPNKTNDHLDQLFSFNDLCFYFRKVIFWRLRIFYLVSYFFYIWLFLSSAFWCSPFERHQSTVIPVKCYTKYW